MPPRTIRLHSETNAFQHAEVLRRNRQKRQQFGEFFVEGVRSINQAIAHSWPITSFLYAPDSGLSEWAQSILRTSTAERHYELTPTMMDKLSAKTDTSELIALVRTPPDDLARISIAPDMLVVVFDRPTSPGNLGSIIRSADALGAHGVIVTGHGADLYDPETIRAATGSLFALPCLRLPSARDLVPWLETVRVQTGAVTVVGTDEAALVEVWQHNFSGPTVLLAGNETWGLSAAFRELADITVRIPMDGSASSLNVAAATSILLYEIRRQRAFEQRV